MSNPGADGPRRGSGDVSIGAHGAMRAAGALAALLLCPLGVAAAEPPETGVRQAGGALRLAQAERSHEFRIPAQPLRSALNAFSATTGWEVGAPAELVQGVMSPGVSGTYAAEEALRVLLTGTRLDYRPTGARSVILERRVSAADGEPEVAMPAVVVSATRTETPVSELTRSVTVVDRGEIERQKRIDRSVGEILSKSVPGFSPSTEALTDFGQTLRGRTFLTLIDGIPQSTPLRDGRRSLNTIDADAIERIEVVRGGSAVYGFGATGGLVNIITRRPEEGAFNVHSEAGIKFSTTHPDDSVEWHTNHRVSGRTGPLDYVVSGTFVQRNSFFDAAGDRIPADPFGVQGGLADTDEFNVLGKLGYQLDENQRAEVSVNHFNIFQDTEFGGLGTGNPAADQKTPAVRGNINVDEPGTENTVVNGEYHNEDLLGSDVKTQVFYGDLTTRFSKFPGFPQVEITSEKLGGRLTVDTPIETQVTDFNAIWGLDYLHDEIAQPELDGPDETPEMEQDAIAGFLQLEVPVAEWGLVRAGVRHEAIWVDVDDVLNTRGVFVRGGTLDFSETLINASATVYVTDEIDVFGGFSQGFSRADIGRAIADTTATSAEQLESEVQEVDHYELGVRARFARWDATATAFFSDSDNGTTFDQDLIITKQPERIYGVEVAANVRPAEHVAFGGTFTWLEGEVDLDDDGDFDEDLPSTRIPPVKVTSYLEYSPYEWWSARLQGLYSANRDPNSTQFGGASVDDYIVVDFHSSVDIGYGRVEVGVENLFNEDYFPVLNQAGALPFAFSQAPGRTVTVTYSIEW